MSAIHALLMHLKEYEALVDAYVLTLPEEDRGLEQLRLSNFLIWARNYVPQPRERLTLVKAKEKDNEATVN